MASYEYGKDNSKFTVNDETRQYIQIYLVLKEFGEKAVLDMMKISEQGINNFVDIYKSIKGTSVNSSVFEKLVKIGYFKKLDQ